MLEATIISQIARKVFYKSAHIPKELQGEDKKQIVSDKVTLSKEAENLQKASQTSKFDKDRDMKLQRVKSLVQNDHYSLDKEVIDKIADKIANSLVF
jgi:hypothetical protein